MGWYLSKGTTSPLPICTDWAAHLLSFKMRPVGKEASQSSERDANHSPRLQLYFIHDIHSTNINRRWSRSHST